MDLCLQRYLWIYLDNGMSILSSCFLVFNSRLMDSTGFNYWEVFHKEATLGFGCFLIPWSTLCPG